LELITGDNITYGDDLLQIGKEILGNKFVGIFTEDDLPIKLKPNTGALVNKPKNEHWVAQYADSTGKLHTFDSYGRTMGPNPVKDLSGFKQKGKQMNCGQRSLTWLYFKLNGMG
jgi:hypothetical protein